MLRAVLTFAILMALFYGFIHTRDADSAWLQTHLQLVAQATGAVVGQQPLGGGRASRTNDKAGSMWNLLRWVNVRTIKETFVPPTDYRYPFMGAE